MFLHDIKSDLGIFAWTQNYLYLNQFLSSFVVSKNKVSTPSNNKCGIGLFFATRKDISVTTSITRKWKEAREGRREGGKALHVFTISKKFLEGRGPGKEEGGNHANGASVCEGNKRLFPRAKCTPVTRTCNAPPPATSLLQVRKLFWNFVRQQRACLNR